MKERWGIDADRLSGAHGALLLRAILLAAYSARQGTNASRAADLFLSNPGELSDSLQALFDSMPDWVADLPPVRTWIDQPGVPSSVDLNARFAGQVRYTLPGTPDRPSRTLSLSLGENPPDISSPRCQPEGKLGFWSAGGEAYDLWPFSIPTERSIALLCRWACGGNHVYTEIPSGRSQTLPGWATSSLLHDRFVAIDLIGAGSFCDVLRTWDVWLDQPMALKCFRASHQELRRFVREGRVGRLLDHPAIAKVHDVHRSGDRVSISQEYVPSPSLSEVLRRDGFFDTERALNVARQVLEALEHAHAQGVVHRDIKPSNVLLSGDRVKVIDFGLSFETGGAHRQSRSNDRIGTPAFMSPEQVRGEIPDARSDIFSVGCLIGAMLTGASPFEEPTVDATYRSILDAAPSMEPLRVRDPVVSDLVETLTAPNPDSRPGSAAQTLELLTLAPVKSKGSHRQSLWKATSVMTTLALCAVASRPDNAPTPLMPALGELSPAARELAAVVDSASRTPPSPPPSSRATLLDEGGFRVDLYPGHELRISTPLLDSPVRIGCEGAQGRAQLGDVDGDGQAEIVLALCGAGVGDTLSPELMLLDDDAAVLHRGVLGNPSPFPGVAQAPFRISRLLLADLRRNQQPGMDFEPVEIALEAHHPVSYPGSVFLFEAIGSSGISGLRWRGRSWSVSGHYHQLAAGDLDGDGVAELVAAGEEVLAGKRVAAFALSPFDQTSGQLPPYRAGGGAARVLWHALLPISASVSSLRVEQSRVVIGTSRGVIHLDSMTGLQLSREGIDGNSRLSLDRRAQRIREAHKRMAMAETRFQGADMAGAIAFLQEARSAIDDVAFGDEEAVNEATLLATIDTRIAEIAVGEDRGQAEVEGLLELWRSGWRDPGLGWALPGLLVGIGGHDDALEIQSEIEAVNSETDLSIRRSRLLWRLGREDEALEMMSRLLGQRPGRIWVSSLPQRMLLESGGWREVREIARRVAKSSLVIDAAAIAALADVRLGGVADDGIAADDLVEARAWKWLGEGEPERAFGEIAAAFDSGAVPADPFSLGRLELLRAFALRASGNFDGARLLATKELGRDRIRGAFWRSLAAELASS